MFLRRGRFRGREHGGNDRGSSQRRFERRGSAPASIEHGAANGVSSAEDDYATNPRDRSQAALPCSRRITPSHWEGTSERTRRGASRIFALSVQGLNSCSQVDLMSQYGRGDCGSSCVKLLDDVPQMWSSPIGLTGSIVPPGFEPPEQSRGASSGRQHSHKSAPCADDNGLGSGNVQQSDSCVDSVGKSEKLCIGQRELSTRNSQAAPFQAVNDKTRRHRNIHSRQTPLDGNGGSGHPVGSIPKRGVLNDRRIEVNDQSSTLKPASCQRDICQNMPDKYSDSTSTKNNQGSAPHQRGGCCDSPEGATVACYLPPILYKSDKKSKKKRRCSRSKMQINSESEHDTSAENLGLRERVTDLKTKTGSGRRRQPNSEHKTSVENLGSRENVVDPKEKVCVARRRQNNSEDNNSAENLNSRERIVDPKKKRGGVQKQQTNLQHVTTAENLGSRERIVDPKMETGVERRRQANSEHATRVEKLGSRERIVDAKEEKTGGGRRRVTNSEHGTHAAKLCNRERIVDTKEKPGGRQRRRTNSEHEIIAENLGSRERNVDHKETIGSGQRKQINSGHHGTIPESLDGRERVVDPKEKIGGRQRRQVKPDHDRSCEIIDSRERLVDPKMKTGAGQRRQTNSEHGTHVEKLSVREEVFDPKKKSGYARGRQSNLEHGTVVANLGSKQRVVDPNEKCGGMQRTQTSECGGNAKIMGPKRSIVDHNEKVQIKNLSGVNVALCVSRHVLEGHQRMTGWPIVSEDEDDWNMDHYGVSHVTSPVTIERPLVSGESSVLCRDEDTGERSHMTVCDVDSETAATSQSRDTSPRYCHNDSNVTSSHNTDMLVHPVVIVTDIYVPDRRSDTITVDDRHHSVEPPMNDDIVTVSQGHAEATMTPHDLTASDSYTQIVDTGSSFYLLAAGHSYHTRLMRPCMRGASAMSCPFPPFWSHRRSSYDYLPVMSLSPPEETGHLEDTARVNGFKRHKSGNQDSRTGNLTQSPSDTLQQPSYPGCAPFLPTCSPRPRYGPPPQWYLQGSGSGSPAPPPDLMFFDNSGHLWPKPTGYHPSQDWYRHASPSEGWYAPVRFQGDDTPLVSSAMQASTAPERSPMTSPLSGDLQLLANCLVPPPPPPSTPPPNCPLITNLSEGKPAGGYCSSWPTTQPTTASYVTRPPCQVFHYGAPSVRYDTPPSSSSTSGGEAQNNVEATKQSSHCNENLLNIPSRNYNSSAVDKGVASGLASNAPSNSVPPATSHEFANAVFSNCTWVNDGSRKDVADQEPRVKSPASQNDDQVVVSPYKADDSLMDDSLMHHCADMAISMATTTENCLQGAAESRGKVKFRVAHYVPPTMRLSSSFSTVTSAESVHRMPGCPKDANVTLPNLGFSGNIDSSHVSGAYDNGQESTPSGKVPPSPRCSPYGPWQSTSTPVTHAKACARTPDGASEFTFQTPRRKSAQCAQVRRLLVSGDMSSVAPPTGPSKNTGTVLMGGAQNSNRGGVSCTSVSSSVDSDLNLCGLGSSVESSPCTSQRISRFSCCSVSSNNSQETWSELSMSFDDVASPGKLDVTDPDQSGKKEEGEIDWFDGECRQLTEKSHNRYEMFPDKRDTTNKAYLGNSLYGGSYSTDLQANNTNHARNRWNLPPRMQRLLQESAAASRAQSLMSKIQQPVSTYADTRSDHSSSWQSFDWRTKLKEIFKKSSEQFLDSHCHLDFLFDRISFKGTFKKYVAVNEDTFCDNFAGCVTVFCHPHTFTTEAGMWTDVLREDNVWGAVGCHPKCATNFTARAERAMRVMLKHDKMVAVGEIGLDYSGTFYQHHEAQKEVLARQLKLATEINKPIVIHSRESESDIISELEKHIPRNHKIHRHCFTGTWEEARTWLHKFPNSYIGLTALLTHRSRRAFPLKDVARYIPLDKLLIETDTPYFVPWRIPKTDMEFCHPGMVITVADEVARLKGIHIDVVLKACYENTRDMYGI